MVIFWILTTRNWFVTKKAWKTHKFLALFPNCRCWHPNFSANFNVWDLRPKCFGKRFLSAFQWCWSWFDNIEKKSRKSMFFKSLRLPFKILEIFFLCILVFFGQKNACAKFLTRSRSFVDSMGPFSYMGSIVLPTLYRNLWSLTHWKVQQKLWCWKN